MYKKLFLVFVSIIAIQTAKAQTEKGTQSLGLSFGLRTTSSDFKVLDQSTNTYGPATEGKLTSYSIGPNYSYFIADKLDLGLSVGYSSTKQSYNSNQISPQEQSDNAFTSSLYLRKYFLYDNKIGIRTGPRFSYQRMNSKQEYNSSTVNFEIHNNIYTGGVGLDFVYFPVKKLGLTAFLGGADYTHQTQTGYTEGTYNSFNLSFANSLILSVNYIF
jgi:hypothetical protein